MYILIPYSEPRLCARSEVCFGPFGLAQARDLLALLTARFGPRLYEIGTL